MDLDWNKFVSDILHKRDTSEEKAMANEDPSFLKKKKRKRKEYEFENESLRQELEKKLEEEKKQANKERNKTHDKDGQIYEKKDHTLTKQKSGVHSQSGVDEGVRSKSRQRLNQLFSNVLQMQAKDDKSKTKQSTQLYSDDKKLQMQIRQFCLDMEACIFNWSMQQFNENTSCIDSLQKIYQEKIRDILFNLHHNDEICLNLWNKLLTPYDLIYSCDSWEIAHSQMKKKRIQNKETLSKQVQSTSLDALWISTSDIHCQYCGNQNTCKYRKVRELNGGTAFEAFGSKSQNDIQLVDVCCQNCNSKFKSEIYF
ncbi:hypothetical protein RFI_18861 [Reticulomyxa filosa]|uniref:TFIIS central domain-containing protein n=1 Tax=Reticulomyxa filosa TaxID=46433 RepID=X6MWN7_RETFI|nr:hypothetical protein RFI_18861 [Reticulomyxa filosa]|eukprot:ETO18403.1 hypothetical protein RFI_18861 [Reticulomyxa filosa]